MEIIHDNRTPKQMIKIISIVLILVAYVQTNVLSNSLYYSQYTPKSKVENVSAITWTNHLKLTKVKKMRYRGIEYGDRTVEIYLGKYSHNYYPNAVLTRTGDSYISFFRGDDRYI